MRRRRLLRLTGVTLTTAAAGCLTESDDGPATGGTDTAGSTDTAGTPPGTERSDETAGAENSAVKAPIYALWSAFNDENFDALLDAYHPDSPIAPDESDVVFEGTVTVERATVLSSSDGSATVEAEVTVTGDSELSETHLYDIRRYRGQWKIWEWGLKDEGSPPPVPQAAFGFEFDGAATDDDGTAVLTITHEAGDTIDAGQLYVRGTGIVDVTGATPSVTAPDTAWGSATGVSEVTAGTTITVGVTVDCSVDLVYESEGSSTVISAYDGPGA